MSVQPLMIRGDWKAIGHDDDQIYYVDIFYGDDQVYTVGITIDFSDRSQPVVFIDTHNEPVLLDLNATRVALVNRCCPKCGEAWIVHHDDGSCVE